MTISEISQGFRDLPARDYQGGSYPIISPGPSPQELRLYPWSLAAFEALPFLRGAPEVAARRFNFYEARWDGDGDGAKLEPWNPYHPNRIME